MSYNKIVELLGEDADGLLNHKSETISKDMLHRRNPEIISDVYVNSNRNPQVLKSLASILGNGRLAKTGYVSILPVDQGIEHTAGASFAPNPIYFDI